MKRFSLPGIISSTFLLTLANAHAQTSFVTSTADSGQAGDTTRVSVDSAGAEGNSSSCDSSPPSISSNGRYVAFDSYASNLVPGDCNGTHDIFVHDRRMGLTTRESVDSAGGEGNGSSTRPSISANGRYVAFSSRASNLVPWDGNGTDDCFVHDRQTGLTTRVSVDSTGVEGNGASGDSEEGGPSISSNGRYVAFDSYASNLVPGDGNGTVDCFVHDRQTGLTTRVSVDSGGAEGYNGSYMPRLSANGCHVAFVSGDPFVHGDGNNAWDIFVHDRRTGLIKRVSVDSAGAEGNAPSRQPSISANGRHVAFASPASNLVPGDGNGTYDIFVHDGQTGLTTRVSVDSSGVEGNGECFTSSISANGSDVAFYSTASNLVSADGNGEVDCFLHDRRTGLTTRVSVDSVGAEGNYGSFWPSISANGRSVAFASGASNLVPEDGNGFRDCFVHDRK